MTCSYCGKETKELIKTWCNACYRRYLKNGILERKKIRHKCRIQGCDKWVQGHGLCSKHYTRMRVHGHLEDTRPKSWGSIEKHPLMHLWRHMNRSKSAKQLNICPQWENDFLQFVSDVGERPSKDHQLRLVVKEIGYYPGNVHWVEVRCKINNPENVKAYRREYAKQYRKLNPLNVKNTTLKKYFGITLREYEAIYELQGGKCAICQKPESAINGNGKLQHLAVDHDHITGKIRGLLCSQCNMSLGGFQDSIALLQTAIQYLAAHS